MYDFSSSDDDSGGLIIGGEDRGTSLAASLPSISSFNNYQKRQNKKKEIKEKMAASPSNPSSKKASGTASSKPVKSSKVVKVPKPPKVPAAKTAKTTKAPKAAKVPKATKVPPISRASQILKEFPVKGTKADSKPTLTKTTSTKATSVSPSKPLSVKVTPPKSASVKGSPPKMTPIKTTTVSPKASRNSKSPKKIKAEPKGGLKLRLSIGGNAPSIDNSSAFDIENIIDLVASGGLGGLDDEDQQFQQQHQQQRHQSPSLPEQQQRQQKAKKPRSPAKNPVGPGSPGGPVGPPGFPAGVVPPKKPRKKRPTSDAVFDTQAAAARAAALADEVIAAVAAEVEVEGGISDDDADPSTADPHRLTVVIPGENEEEIDAITGSPQHEQDAIQGMLSMSGTYSFAATASDEIKRSKTAGNLERLKQRLAAKRGILSPGRPGQPERRGGVGGLMGHQRDEEDEFERALRNCRQDDDFIYLGIDANDDDWKSMKKRAKSSGGRISTSGTDQTWNPKGVSLKGVTKGEQRPQREGVKREVMESTLAESTKFDPALESGPDEDQVKAPKVKGPPREKKDPVSKMVKSKKEVVQKVSTEPKIRRPGKKGMATAKQRLGKILKIHRMYH
ncbi:uncharacterized protein LOC111272994 [Varroa jacobsoni]|uniref:uncharacterized protein LOC111272994 n=1 Tax=Varroa jacobsoni TaxID=62625 RepID=UPI000BF58429|nr:uncharacterized protein LOC111272994 [Varroa jacobsoni]XP_022710412.1 uncharacterized protein LOC111272994 [Varroa jacobsoni]